METKTCYLARLILSTFSILNNIRLIPRLDIKGSNLIKGVRLEGLRVMGDPEEFAMNYYDSGADELLYMDIVASLYGRNSLDEIIKKVASRVFIPITVGGGIRSIDDAIRVIRSGADKVAINTAAISNPKLISDISNKFGSQAMVLSIEAKKISDETWEAYTDNGREKTGLNVLEWVEKGVELGAGEILVTSVDREGTRSGFDIPLLKKVANVTNVPIIASGGMGKIEHLIEITQNADISAIAMADVLHYKRITIKQIRKKGLESGINLRKISVE